MKDFLKTFKEELIAIPLFMLFIYGYRYFMGIYFPESAQFDLMSEAENIMWALIKLVIFTSATWLSIRIVFPNLYKFMQEEYKNDYKTMPKKEKRDLSTKVFFGFLITLALLL